MGSMSKRLRKAAKNNQANTEQRIKADKRMLTEDEYNALVKDVKAYIIDGVLYDTLSVVVDILQHDWGKLAKKDTRMKVFGDLYKAKLDKQCKSHSTDSHEMLIAAGIVERSE